MEPLAAVGTAAVLVWLGMVLAISFLEAPLKFRAPGVTLPIGLGIGRIVFAALNVSEVALGAIALGAVVLSAPERSAVLAVAAPLVVLLAQLTLVRPALARRTRMVLAGADGPRSHAHLAYIGLEVLKVVVLAVAGGWLLTR